MPTTGKRHQNSVFFFGFKLKLNVKLNFTRHFFKLSHYLVKVGYKTYQFLTKTPSIVEEQFVITLSPPVNALDLYY